MDPRARVRAALEHREPDRVPRDLGAVRMTGIHVRAYAGLRRELGLPDRAVRLGDLWGGGIDTQRVLGSGTPEEVRTEVAQRITDLAPGGGFVFASVHNVQADVPPENAAAMWEAVAAHGTYTIRAAVAAPGGST